MSTQGTNSLLQNFRNSVSFFTAPKFDIESGLVTILGVSAVLCLSSNKNSAIRPTTMMLCLGGILAMLWVKNNQNGQSREESRSDLADTIAGNNQAEQISKASLSDLTDKINKNITTLTEKHPLINKENIVKLKAWAETYKPFVGESSQETNQQYQMRLLTCLNTLLEKQIAKVHKSEFLIPLWSQEEAVLQKMLNDELKPAQTKEVQQTCNP